MDTAVALVSAYLRLNGYVALPEEPILIGEGRPWRYHTATDVDVLAVRFPNAAVVVPRDSGRAPLGEDEDLHLSVDPVLELEDGTVDVLVGEVKEGRPRLNSALRDGNVLYATLRRLDPGFDEPLERCIARLIRNGVDHCSSAGRRWRFRLVAFGEGAPVREEGPFTVISLRHVARYVIGSLREHRKVWRNAQFGDPVLGVLHLLDKLELLGASAREPARVASTGEFEVEALEDEAAMEAEPGGTSGAPGTVRGGPGGAVSHAGRRGARGEPGEQDRGMEMTRASRSTESLSRDHAAIRDILRQARTRLTVPDRATLALGLMGHLATLMNRHQMAKLLRQIEDEVLRVQDVPPLRGGVGGVGSGHGYPPAGLAGADLAGVGADGAGRAADVRARSPRGAVRRGRAGRGARRRSRPWTPGREPYGWP